MAMAMVNVCVDAIMIVQARKDPEYGTKDLISMMFMTNGLSGTVGMFMGAEFTSRGQPKYCYLIFGIVGLACSFCGMNLNS